MKISLPAGLRGLLRLEGLCELIVALALYAHVSGSWVTFAIVFFGPDLALLGYLVNARTGAVAYNVTHSYIGPALVALAGLTFAPPALPFALIWAAHIGFDRTLGYGLKSRAGFAQTHLGLIARGAV
jgi:Domain of unknown function (DUF4260)